MGKIKFLKLFPIEIDIEICSPYEWNEWDSDELCDTVSTTRTGKKYEMDVTEVEADIHDVMKKIIDIKEYAYYNLGMKLKDVSLYQAKCEFVDRTKPVNYDLSYKEYQLLKRTTYGNDVIVAINLGMRGKSIVGICDGYLQHIDGTYVPSYYYPYDWAKEIYKFVESLDYYNDWDERYLH